jgi:hypothetical protein
VSLTDVLPEASASSSPRAMFVIRRSLCGMKLSGSLLGFKAILLRDDEYYTRQINMSTYQRAIATGDIFVTRKKRAEEKYEAKTRQPRKII